jgi:hypothetical protein
MNQKKSGLDARPKIDRTIQDRIGRELRAMYEELLRQPLPENLLEPLRTSDAVHATRSKLEEAVQGMRRPILDASTPAPTIDPASQAPVSAPQAKLA